jgi:hypothetical protein
MTTLAVALMTVLFMNACGGGDGDDGPAPPAPIPAGTAARLVTMTTSMSTPTTVFNPAGTATGKLAVNMETGEIGGAILYSGLSTSTIAAGIYDSAAAPGSLAIVPLSGGTGTTGAWTVPAGTSLDVFKLSALVNGGLFFRLDTTNLTGDKRGDITFPSITITTQMPPVAGTGSAGGGTGTLTVHLGTGAISGTVSYSGLTSPAVAGHIYLSSDNSVIVTLTGGGAQAGTFSIPANTFLTTTQLKALANNGLYLAIHSQNFQAPVSELFGNIVYPVTTIPPVTLNGDEEVPPVIAAGSNGTGNLTVSLGTGKISGSVAFNTQASNATLSHIHQGFAGTNGPPIITLTGGETLTSGTWNVPANRFLNAVELGSLISNGLYLNVHTVAHANGEIRGQIKNVPTN